MISSRIYEAQAKVDVAPTVSYTRRRHPVHLAHPFPSVYILHQTLFTVAWNGAKLTGPHGSSPLKGILADRTVSEPDVIPSGSIESTPELGAQ